MMYEDQLAYLSPLGGLSSPTFEQDFWQGAKPSASLSSATSTTKFIDYQEDDLFNNMDISNFSHCNKLDDEIEEVVLPNLSHFGPEDLFTELDGTEPLNKASSFLTQPRVPTSPLKTPNSLTIKLKKVKHPKVFSKCNIKDNTDMWSSVPLQQVDNTRQPILIQRDYLHPVLESNIHFDLPPLQEVKNPVYATGMDFAPLYTLISEMTESRLDASENPALDGDVSLINAVSLDDSDAILDSILSDNDENLQVLSGDSTFEYLNSPSSFTSGNWSGNSTSGGSSPEFASLELDEGDFLHWSPYNSASSVDGILFSSAVSSPLSSAPSSPIQHTISSPEYDPFTRLSTINETEIGLVSQKPSIKARKNKLSREVKYLRKKRQNKEAALRYRQKKRSEECEINEGLRKEQDENDKLKKQFTDMRREIKFVKKLMRETFFTE